MANMFKCALAGGGDGASLIVTCTQNFAGSTITLTNGTKTYTQVCPLSSPYEVTFESVATGAWTVSGIAQGQTISTSVTITNFEALLADIPEGSTVTPTDDIQIWLHCANIFDKAYTTISQVLADASTVQSLIASSNAVDYMARSTTWASDVTADSSAMSYIGLDNYCADTLLADSTWLTAICNSSYFESVLTVKVPTMTSNTTPSGVCFADSSGGASGQEIWKAFDNTNTNYSDAWSSTQTSFPHYLGYGFTQDVKIYKLSVTNRNHTQDIRAIKNFKLQGSDAQSSEYNDISPILTHNSNNSSYTQTYVINNQGQKYKYNRIYITSGQETSTNAVIVAKLQFYGRA